MEGTARAKALVQSTTGGFEKSLEGDGAGGDLITEGNIVLKITVQ